MYATTDEDPQGTREKKRNERRAADPVKNPKTKARVR